MSFKDFVANFSMLDICHLTTDTLVDEESGGGNLKKMLLRAKTCWNSRTVFSSWRRNHSAGGCFTIPDPVSATSTATRWPHTERLQMYEYSNVCIEAKALAFIKGTSNKH